MSPLRVFVLSPTEVLISDATPGSRILRLHSSDGTFRQDASNVSVFIGGQCNFTSTKLTRKANALSRIASPSGMAIYKDSLFFAKTQSVAVYHFYQ